MIDLLNEAADGDDGPARRWLENNQTAKLWITPITLAEVLEGAVHPDAIRAYLGRYSWQGIHRTHAERVAMLQRRAAQRLGEHDAWQAAIADSMGAVVVGHDPAAFQHLGDRYDDHRRSERAR